jgi:hypothetical protein
MKTYTGWHFTATETKGRDGWPLKPTEELPEGTELELCVVGLHACKSAFAALTYAPGPWVSRVRLEGRVLTDADKACATRRVRLAGPVDVTRELRLFSVDCAERVLPIFEKTVPGDARPRQAIETARRFAVGQATAEELVAAWAAAGGAAWAAAAAGAAAGDDAWAAAWAAGDDVWAAAGAAAGARRDAAAARDDVWAAEKRWQDQTLTSRLKAALKEKG